MDQNILFCTVLLLQSIADCPSSYWKPQAISARQDFMNCFAVQCSSAWLEHTSYCFKAQLEICTYQWGLQHCSALGLLGHCQKEHILFIYLNTSRALGGPWHEGTWRQQWCGLLLRSNRNRQNRVQFKRYCWHNMKQWWKRLSWNWWKSLMETSDKGWSFQSLRGFDKKYSGKQLVRQINCLTFFEWSSLKKCG